MAGRAGPVAILAGSGDLPLLIADRLAASGRDHRILAFRGFACRAVRARADAVLGLLDVKRAVACLEGWAPASVTLAGGVRRPDPSVLMGAFSAFRSRDEIAAVLARGDDNLLRAVLGLLEEKGHRLVGVHELAPELLAKTARYSAVGPSSEQRAAIEVGLSLLGRMSPFDIGQAAIIRGRRVLAVEGPEGTDRMLARAGRLAGGGLFRRSGRGGVLVKAAKAGQDRRVDLPAIGPRTVANAARAGLAGIAVGSGSTLILDAAATAAAADRLGLFLVGVEAAELPA